MPEKRVVLEKCGNYDAADISSFIEAGGFTALKAAKRMKPKKIIEAVKSSGLTGRGGAGFSCGLKWEIAANSGPRAVLICNADEGEVGTFKDRYILTNDPFTLIEGMAIAGRALGAVKGYIYLRCEYHSLLEPLERALARSREKGYLDQMEIEIFEGAGAYVCGEESALMNSIEGFRGESRYKPPYPPVRGLWNMPTVINNVETLMNIPAVIKNGPKWFSGLGTGRSKGTKVFSVSGDVSRPGVYEMEMGASLRELVVDLAGADDILAVQVGGAAGNIVPSYMIETPLSLETVLGAGAVTVFDSTRDIIDIVYRNMIFLNDESCGKCTPCREGTEVLVEIYGRLARGEGRDGDIAVLEELVSAMAAASLCGLGQSAAVPVLDSLKYFREEYGARVEQSEFLRSYLGEKL